MKVLVIGTIVRDRILNFGRKEEFSSFGGLTYNIVAFALLFKKPSVIIPVSWIGDKDIKEYYSFLEEYSLIDASCIYSFSGESNGAFLEFDEFGGRKESVSLSVPTLQLDHLKYHLDSDFCHINFIWGDDVSFEAIRELKSRSSCFLSIDMHNKGALYDTQGVLKRNKWTDCQKWLELTDYLQLNEDEFKYLGIHGRNFKNKCKAILGMGVKYIVITRGSKGASGIFSWEGKNYLLDVHATRHIAFDPTGCGDQFSAGFIYGLASGKSPFWAFLFALSVAGYKSSVRGPSHFLNSDQYISIMNENYINLLNILELENKIGETF